MGESPGTRAGLEAIDSLTRRLGNALAAAYTAAVVVDVLRADVRTAALVDGRDSPPAGVLLAGTPTLRRAASALGSSPVSQNAIWRSLEDVARAVASPGLREAALVMARFRVACLTA